HWLSQKPPPPPQSESAAHCLLGVGPPLQSPRLVPETLQVSANGQVPPPVSHVAFSARELQSLPFCKPPLHLACVHTLFAQREEKLQDWVSFSPPTQMPGHSDSRSHWLPLRSPNEHALASTGLPAVPLPSQPIWVSISPVQAPLILSVFLPSALVMAAALFLSV